MGYQGIFFTSLDHFQTSLKFSIQHVFKAKASPGIFDLPTGEAEIVELQFHEKYTSNNCTLHVDTAQL